VAREACSRTRERIDDVGISGTWPAMSAAGRSELARKPGAGPATARLTGSDESESQKAGAEQGHPARSQGKEAVGNEISISHDTPSDSNARPN
jgi:hypothetical protein